MQKTAIFLATLLLPLTALADDTVAVDSLTVKERIKSIEQINVTAEKPRADIAPQSQRVAEILETLKEEPGTVAQPATPAQSD